MDLSIATLVGLAIRYGGNGVQLRYGAVGVLITVFYTMIGMFLTNFMESANMFEPGYMSFHIQNNIEYTFEIFNDSFSYFDTITFIGAAVEVFVISHRKITEKKLFEIKQQYQSSLS